MGNLAPINAGLESKHQCWAAWNGKAGFLGNICLGTLILSQYIILDKLPKREKTGKKKRQALIMLIDFSK